MEGLGRGRQRGLGTWQVVSAAAKVPDMIAKPVLMGPADAVVSKEHVVALGTGTSRGDDGDYWCDMRGEQIYPTKWLVWGPNGG